MTVQDIDHWRIIDDAAKAAPSDPAMLADQVTKRLASLTAAEIIAYAAWFDERMDQITYERFFAIAQKLIGHCSDDGFEDFSAWLISRGRSSFEAAMRDPGSLLLLKTRIGTAIDCGFTGEPLLYAHQQAYENVTGEPWEGME